MLIIILVFLISSYDFCVMARIYINEYRDVSPLAGEIASGRSGKCTRILHRRNYSGEDVHHCVIVYGAKCHR